jgi:hypothetical protein
MRDQAGTFKHTLFARTYTPGAEWPCFIDRPLPSQEYLNYCFCSRKLAEGGEQMPNHAIFDIQGATAHPPLHLIEINIASGPG